MNPVLSLPQFNRFFKTVLIMMSPYAKTLSPMNRFAFQMVFALCSATLWSAFHCTWAQESLADTKVGQLAPAWENLLGTDDARHGLADLKDQDVVVVCFSCNTCPYAIDYEDRMIALQGKYLKAKQKVVLVTINSNALPVDSIQAMKERGEQKKYNFVYLKDEDHSVARAYAASYTPEFYVLDRERRIVYQGALDDVTDAKNVQVRYVELAVDAALNSTTPEIQAVPARGCAIRFARTRSRPPRDQ